jgi:hypothetical protein
VSAKKSREHRIRVLENQAKLATEHSAPTARQQHDPQLKFPLIVEVKRGAAAKQPSKRTRRRSAGDQPDLGEL